MRRLALIGLACAVAAVPTAAATAMGTKNAKVKTGFSGGKFTFAPKSVTISKGGKVTFSFADGARHNVTPSGSKSFKRIPDRSSGSVTRQFTKAGTYSYYCTIHGRSMSGKIVVK